MKILFAAYYIVAEKVIAQLLKNGQAKADIRVLTYDVESNKELLNFLKETEIDCFFGRTDDPDVIRLVRQWSPDVLFSLYYRDRISDDILSIPSKGAVNLHPSLLPQYKGAFSAPWVIFNGEKQTGITYHYMTSEIDAGDIILQKKIDISENETAYSLYYRLIDEGVENFSEVYTMIRQGRVSAQKQQGESSYYRRGVPYGGFIDRDWPEDKIKRFIRAMYFPPYRGAVLVDESGIEHEFLSVEDYEKYINKNSDKRSA